MSRAEELRMQRLAPQPAPAQPRVNTTTLAGVRAASGTPMPPAQPPVIPTSPAGVQNALNTIRAAAPARSGTQRQTTTTPVQMTPSAPAADFTTPGFGFTLIEPEETPYNVYDDPFYQQALAGAQSRFNLDRIDAMAGMQYQQKPIERELELRPGVAEQQRRRLAGSFAARGMGGGRAGVLTRAEAEMNAREIAGRTGLREQVAELGRQFTSQFGAEGTDWLGTRRGMEAQQAAIQQALQNRLGGLTTVG